MAILQKKMFFSCSLLVLPVLLGCGSVTRTPDYSRPYWTMENPLVSRSQSEGSSKPSSQIASSDTPRGTSTASSLEALQSGQSTETPASSPLKDIYFDFDRYDLQADARETLKTNAAWLKANPSARVQIEGHCDERGTDEYNLALGARRGQAAKDYLVELGIAAQRLSTISYGEEIPVCKEQTEACWEKNRRDRFVVLSARPAS